MTKKETAGVEKTIWKKIKSVNPAEDGTELRSEIRHFKKRRVKPETEIYQCVSSK